MPRGWLGLTEQMLYTDLKSEATYHGLASCSAYQATLHANY